MFFVVAVDNKKEKKYIKVEEKKKRLFKYNLEIKLLKRESATIQKTLNINWSLLANEQLKFLSESTAVAVEHSRLKIYKKLLLSFW